MSSKKPYFKNIGDFLSWEFRQAFWTLVHNRGVDNVDPPKPQRERGVRSKGIPWMDLWKHDTQQYDTPRKKNKKKVKQQVEAPEYQEAHRLLRNMLESAVQAGGKFGGIERLDETEGRITACTPIARDSFLRWVFTNKDKIFPLRHFPEDEEDLLLELMAKLHETEKSFSKSTRGEEKANGDKGGRPSFDPDGEIKKLIQKLKNKNIPQNSISDKPELVKGIIKIQGRTNKTSLEFYEIRQLSDTKYTKTFGFSRASIKRISEAVYNS